MIWRKCGWVREIVLFFTVQPLKGLARYPMSDAEPTASVTFHLEKTPGFQTLHADGVVGGITPSGSAFLAFFTDRAPMPKRIIHEMSADGTLGKVRSVEGKDGIFREVHTGITMTRVGLESLKAHAEKLIKQMGEDGES